MCRCMIETKMAVVVLTKPRTGAILCTLCFLAGIVVCTVTGKVITNYGTENSSQILEETRGMFTQACDAVDTLNRCAKDAKGAIEKAMHLFQHSSTRNNASAVLSKHLSKLCSMNELIEFPEHVFPIFYHLIAFEAFQSRFVSTWALAKFSIIFEQKLIREEPLVCMVHRYGLDGKECFDIVHRLIQQTSTLKTFHEADQTVKNKLLRQIGMNSTERLMREEKIKSAVSFHKKTEQNDELESVFSIFDDALEDFDNDLLFTSTNSTVAKSAFQATVHAKDIAIVSLCSEEQHGAKVVAESARNRLKYASKHGYKLFFETQPLIPTYQRGWNNLKVLAKHMASGDYEWYVNLDCDYSIVNFDISIESLIDESLRRHPDDSGTLNLVTEHELEFNGFEIFRNHPWTFSMLATIFGYRPALHSHTYYYTYMKDSVESLEQLEGSLRNIQNDSALAIIRAAKCEAAMRSIVGEPQNPFTQSWYDSHDAWQGLFFQGIAEAAHLGIMYNWDRTERGTKIKTSVFASLLDRFDSFRLEDLRFLPLINDGLKMGYNRAKQKDIPPQDQLSFPLTPARVLEKWRIRSSASLAHSLAPPESVPYDIIHDFSKGFSPATLLAHTTSFSSGVIQSAECDTAIDLDNQSFVVKLAGNYQQPDHCRMALFKSLPLN